jgi:hypothetical protein
MKCAHFCAFFDEMGGWEVGKALLLLFALLQLSPTSSTFFENREISSQPPKKKKKPAIQAIYSGRFSSRRPPHPPTLALVRRRTRTLPRSGVSGLSRLNSSRPLFLRCATVMDARRHFRQRRSLLIPKSQNGSGRCATSRPVRRVELTAGNTGGQFHKIVQNNGRLVKTRQPAPACLSNSPAW